MPVEPLSESAFSSLVLLYQDTLARSLRRSRRSARLSRISMLDMSRANREAHNRYSVWSIWLMNRRPVSMNYKDGELQLRSLPVMAGEQPTDTLQDNGSTCPRSGGMPSVIDSINTKQFAYPNFRDSFHNESMIVDGWDTNYKWYTFEQMVTADRGYDYWLWPISTLYALQQAELLHHSANPTTFSIIRQCEGKLKEINKQEMGRVGGHIVAIHCGEGKKENYIHDNVVWRSDNMKKVYRWYAKSGGWSD